VSDGDPRYPDSLGMWEAAVALPEQLSTSLIRSQQAFGSLGAAAGSGVPVRNVAAVGLGTGGTACEAAAALVAPQLPVPFWVGHGAELPAFVGHDTLLFAVSSSGATEETLAAASEAVARGARVVAVGGVEDDPLARLAADRSLPWSGVDPGGGPARTMLAAVAVPLLVALSVAGLIPDCAPSISEAGGVLAARRDAAVARGGPPETLARHLGRTIPLFYGSSGIGAVAAHWWKAQVNLNAKAPAFAASVPALTYGELAGWGQSGDLTRQAMTLVLLRHGGEDARTAELFEAVRAATDEVMANVFELWAAGEDDLCRFFDLALLGALVSLHLSGREGVDPGPAPAVEEAHA
jgi:glucose/mannose-6-phosphate isomerase